MVAQLYVNGHKGELKVISFDITVCLQCKILLLFFYYLQHLGNNIFSGYAHYYLIAAFSKAR